MFSPTVAEFWQAALGGDPLHVGPTFSLRVSPDLDADERVMLLATYDGRATAVVTPDMAERLGLNADAGLDLAGFRTRLAAAGVLLHGADHVFYFSEAEKAALSLAPADDNVRVLGPDDAAVFAAFEAAASPQDLDDAYVELDHWLVFGAFADGRLASAASCYPWRGGSAMADLGVLSLPPFRGRGLARRTVRAMARRVIERGLEPQYRCQLDNHASVALAKAAGLTAFGTWELVSPDSPV